MDNNEYLNRVKEAAKEGAKEAVTENAGKFRSRGGFLRINLSSVLMIAVLLCGVYFVRDMKSNIKDIKEQFTVVKPVRDHDMTIDNNGVLGFTVADFQDAILGASTRQKKLIVYKREMTLGTDLTKAGFANLKLTAKTQLITYKGIATYTVDLASLNRDCIKMDSENKEIILTVPTPVLEELNIPPEDIVFGDVSKGWLAFGDIKMTPEDSNNIMVGARREMIEKLEQSNEIDTAKKFANMSVWEIYQPLVLSVSPEYKLTVEFV